MATQQLQYQAPILIEWHDAMSTSGWQCLEEIAAEAALPTTLSHFSVGFFVGTTKEGIIVAQSYGVAENNLGDTLNIPWGCVKGVSMLVEGVKLNVQRVAQSNRLRVG